VDNIVLDLLAAKGSPFTFRFIATYLPIRSINSSYSEFSVAERLT